MADTLTTPPATRVLAGAGVVRADIQGLRAIAVLLVLGFHLWPERLSGGYVGVDAFLVISGFLITSHLLRRPPRTLHDLADFWARRLRRLLPASLLVIAVTVLAGILVLPASRLTDLGREAGAAVGYVVNWVLAAGSVDYLAAENAPSPVQHYWSLSVEEQFYFIWPILMMVVLALIARVKSESRWTLVVTLSVFTAASLVTSIVWTSIAPASAYFVTPTRLWELGAGGVLAAVLAARASRETRVVPDTVRSAAAWLGLAAIAIAALTFTGDTPFPGYAALLPVAGTALVIAASAAGSWSPTRILAWRPIQHIGDVSYSLYLWHWPLIVLLPFALGSPLGLVTKVAIVIASVVLATLTKSLVEDPVRRAAWISARVRRTFVLTALAMALTLAVCAIPLARVAAIAAAATQQLENAEQENVDCFGAAALGAEDCDLRGIGVVPAPAVAIDDKSDAYTDNCFSFPPFDAVESCVYGPDDAAIRIALVGNSHAGHWLPALQEFVRTHDAQVTTFIGSRCRPASELIVFDTVAESEGCRDWGREVVERSASGGFDLVVASVASNGELVGVSEDDFFAASVEAYREPLDTWSDAGQRVLVIRDTPVPGYAVPDCVSSNITDLDRCDGTRQAWLPPDPFATAAAELGDPAITVTDFSDRFCDDATCFSVLGGVLVYFDAQHVSGTFSRTLAPYLAEAIDSALREAP